MWRFISGILVGLGIAWLTRSKYVEDLVTQQRMAEIQKRAEAVLIASRQVLEETRKELAAATEAGRVSLQNKAERIRLALEHPEIVEEERGALPPLPREQAEPKPPKATRGE